MQLRPDRIAGPYLGKQVRDIALLLLTVLAVYLCWVLARPFLAAIVWALALAVIAHPLHRRCETFLPPNAAALVSVLAVTAVLLAPGAFLLQRFFYEAVAGVRLIRHNLDPAVFPTLTERNPYFAMILHWLQATFDPNQGMKRAAAFLAGQAPTVISGSVQVITQSAMMLVTLFYFLRDHRRLLGFLLRIAPLSSTESQQLVNRVSEAISATLYGNLAVKLVQGVLGGLMFWILGLPAPLLFGILVSLLAMLPVVGTSLVWGPAAFRSHLSGELDQRDHLGCVGRVVISLIDNLLHPFLVATELRFGVLFAVFGGLVAFGLPGVVLGPVILAFTVALLEVWTQRKADAIAE